LGTCRPMPRRSASSASIVRDRLGLLWRGGIAWSPSGHDIVYVRYQWFDQTCSGGVYANGTLWRVNPLTGDRRQLTSNTGGAVPVTNSVITS